MVHFLAHFTAGISNDIAHSLRFLTFLHALFVAGGMLSVHGHRTVLTSRPEGINPEQMVARGYTEFDLKKFTQEQQESVLKRQLPESGSKFMTNLLNFTESQTALDKLYGNLHPDQQKRLENVPNVANDDYTDIRNCEVQKVCDPDAGTSRIASSVNDLLVHAADVAEYTEEELRKFAGVLRMLVVKTEAETKSNSKPALYIGPLKTKDRIGEKEKKYQERVKGYSYCWIQDIVRSSFACKNVEQMLAVMELIHGHQNMKVVKLKNLFAELDPTHFRRIMLNVRVSLPQSGASHIVEVQLHYWPIFVYKSKNSDMMHKPYTYFRTLFDGGSEATMLMGKSSARGLKVAKPRASMRRKRSLALSTDEDDGWMKAMQKRLEAWSEFLETPVIMAMLVVVLTNFDFANPKIERLPSSKAELYTLALDAIMRRRVEEVNWPAADRGGQLKALYTPELKCNELIKILEAAMQKVAFANQFAPGEGDNNSLGVRRQFTLNHVIRAIQGKEPGGRPPMDQKGAHIKFHKDEGTLVKTQDGACIWADENKETLLHYLGLASPRVPHGTDVQVLLEVLKGTSVVQVRVDNGCEDFRGFGYMQTADLEKTFKFRKGEGTTVKKKYGAFMWWDSGKKRKIHFSKDHLGSANDDKRVPHGTHARALEDVYKGTALLKVQIESETNAGPCVGYMRTMDLQSSRIKTQTSVDVVKNGIKRAKSLVVHTIGGKSGLTAKNKGKHAKAHKKAKKQGKKKKAKVDLTMQEHLLRAFVLGDAAAADNAYRAPTLKVLENGDDNDPTTTAFQAVHLSLQESMSVAHLTDDVLAFERTIQNADDALAFLRNERLTNLRSLANPILWQKIGPLLLGRTTVLDLSNRGLGVDAGRALGGGLRVNDTLQKLDVSTNNLGTLGVSSVVAGIMENKTLTSLVLCSNGAGDEGARAIGRMLDQNKVLEVLDLRGNAFGAIGITRIVAGLQNNSTCNRFFVDDSSFDVQTAEEASKHTGVQHGQIVGKHSLGIDADSWVSLGTSAWLPSPSKLSTTPVKGDKVRFKASLEEPQNGWKRADKNSLGVVLNVINEGENAQQYELEFSKSFVYQHAFASELDIVTYRKAALSVLDTFVFGAALKTNKTLVQLFLDGRSLGADAGRSLGAGLAKNTMLQELNLGHNNFGAEGIASLASSLATNKTLLILELNHNNIGDSGAAVLCKALAKNTTLKELKLRGCSIGDSGAASFEHVLANTTALTLLNLVDNAYTDKGVAALVEGLGRSFGTTRTMLYVSNENMDPGGVGEAKVDAAIAAEQPVHLCHKDTELVVSGAGTDCVNGDYNCDYREIGRDGMQPADLCGDIIRHAPREKLCVSPGVYINEGGAAKWVFRSVRLVGVTVASWSWVYTSEADTPLRQIRQDGWVLAESGEEPKPVEPFPKLTFI